MAEVGLATDRVAAQRMHREMERVNPFMIWRAFPLHFDGLLRLIRAIRLAFIVLEMFHLNAFLFFPSLYVVGGHIA